MSGLVEVKIKGFEELNRKLAKLEGKQAKAAIRKASRASMKPLKRKMQAHTPTMTGDLENTYKVRAIKRTRTGVGTRISFAEDWQFYGAFLELGTKDRYQKKTDPPKFVGRIPQEYPTGGLGFARGTALQHRAATRRYFGFLLGKELEAIARRG